MALASGRRRNQSWPTRGRRGRWARTTAACIAPSDWQSRVTRPSLPEGERAALNRIWLIGLVVLLGLVVALSASLGLAAQTAATDAAMATSLRGNGLIASTPGQTERATLPSYAILVGDWHFNPATGHWYAQVEDLTWFEAEAYAVRLGGHLVTINDQAEENWLVSTFGIGDQFIGFNDLASEGTWVWSSGEPVTYVHYPPGQPASGEHATSWEPDPDGSGGVWWADVSADGVYPALLEVPREPAGWIAGTVTADGSPVSGITVEALVQDAGGQWVLAGSATTDESGAFEIGDLVPSEYRIAFRGGADFADLYWGGGRSADSATTVSLTTGGVVESIDGAMVPSGYRESGGLVSTLSTHIPTPADVSTDPPVVGANLFLAALVMILFTAAGELLNRTLAENEELLVRTLRPVRSLGRLRERADAALRRRIQTGRLLDALRLAGIAAIYGLIFSLLDRTWDPLTAKGLWLFLSMAIAVGFVGIADDVACWVRARRWGAAPDLDLRTGNLVLALTSTVASRLVAIVPGIMIGMPEALEVSDDRLDDRHRVQLAATGLGTLVVVGGGAWLLTAGTAAARSVSPDGDLPVLVGGLEALLLIVFAVAVQNLFAQFLAFHGTPGRVLRERHRVAWFLGLLGVTFLFWHTLVNPRGDLAAALQSTNVQAFLATAVGFTIFATVVWAGLRVARQRAPRARGGTTPG